MSQELATRTASVPAELQEKVLLGGDLAKLTPTERLSYYTAVCTSLGLNPLTRPFEYLVLNERMVLYARKDCTDQLRDLHGISVEIAGREIIDGICVVTARAKNMTERIDESVGAVPFMKEDGDWKSSGSGKSYFQPNGQLKPLSLADRSNAMMKAETKAKRRVTLSICGLGMLDEAELDTLPEAKKLYHAEDEMPHKVTRAEIASRTSQAAPGGTNGPLRGSLGTVHEPSVEEALANIEKQEEPPEELFRMASAVADYEIVIGDSTDRQELENLWGTIVKDPRITSEYRANLYKHYMAKLKVLEKRGKA